jgi:alkanesulfonate monooxygenase SsuD/methylene tetrahydromethanopterin reductase-like flavin-dependent oxidoreductase (luciferase family)
MIGRAARAAGGAVRHRGGPSGDWPALRDFVQLVEALGFDGYWHPDHPLLRQDCWTTLAAVAAVTRRLRRGSLVSCGA